MSRQHASKRIRSAQDLADVGAAADHHKQQAQQYPIEFWYSISRYIQPENIGRFALICRTTNYVVSMRSFWMCLLRKSAELTMNYRSIVVTVVFICCQV
jgi:hypothetical protein